MSWYKMHRGWMGHGVFENEPFSHRSMWAWIIENASIKKVTINVKGKPVNLERGQLCFSQRFLAEAWHVSRRKVRTALSKFERFSLITVQIVHGHSLITVNEYGLFQDKPVSGPASDPVQSPAKPMYTARSGSVGEKAAQQVTQPRPNPDPNNKKLKNKRNNQEGYWFEGAVIRLVKQDYFAWLQRYPGSQDQFERWLSSRDDWYAQQDVGLQDRWFWSTSNKLAEMEVV